MKKSFLLYLFISATFIVQAGMTTYRTKYTGLQLNNNAPALNVQDDYFFTMLNNPAIPGQGNGGYDDDFVNASVKNRIRLVYIGGDKEHNVNTQDWTATVTFDVEVRDETNTVISTLLNRTLSISNDVQTTLDPLTKNEAVFELLKSGYRLSIRNFTFSGFPSNSQDFELIAEIETERYFKLDYPSPFSYNFNFGHSELDINNSVCINSNSTQTTWDNKIRVFWEYVNGAEEYEVEWYFNSDENSVQYSQLIAPNNNPLPSFIPTLEWTRITTTFDDYQINLPFDKGILFYRVRPVGRFLTNPESKYYGDWSPIGEYLVLNDEPNKNWQYSATYAEEGKVKEVVSFFDGSGRNRQAVTRSSTDDISLVTETMYDYEGRPVIQTLPAPSLDRTQNLGFHCNYTLNNVNTLLKKEDYDYFPDCDLEAPKLGTNEGASNYYSSNNPEKNNQENQVIPDAEQYPYTQSVFGRDGRIKYQSAPGAKHNITDNGTINDNRFTKFSYATPLQFKIDRLFGNEVGYASHYKVKAVEDANGQVSLSYLDLSDNVIATSLIGEEPANLQALTSNTGPTQVQADFNNLNNYQSNTESYVINSKFLVEVMGSHQFNYSLTPEVVSTLCGSPDYGCVYDLIITIYDDCDRKIYDSGLNTSGNPYSSADNTVLHTQYITLNTANTTTGNFIVNFNELGTYSIRKELILNQAALDAATQDFKDNYAVNCFTPNDMIINAEDCDDCETFCANNPTLCDPNECNSANVGLSCDILLDQLITDMSPGGQYFDNLSGVTSGMNTWLELFIVPDVGGTFDPNNDVSVDAVWADMNFFNPATQSYCKTWNEVRQHWQSSWVTQLLNQPSGVQTFLGKTINSLVEAHPEYCHYTTCKTLETSSQFNQDFSSNNLLPTQFTSILGTSAYSGNLSTFLNDMVNADPFFNGTIVTGFNTSQMLNRPYDEVITGSGTTLQDNIEDIITTSGQPINTMDEAWPFIKSAYLERKHLWVKDYKENQDCYYLLDYKDAGGTIGNFDNVAETFLPPISFVPTFVLNQNAYLYYQNNPLGPQPPNNSGPFGLFYANVIKHKNSFPLFPYNEALMHEFYFSGFQIREPDYLDFFNNGVGSGQPGFPADVPSFANQFGSNMPPSPCGQLVSCSDLSSTCITDWLFTSTPSGQPTINHVTTPSNYANFSIFFGPSTGFPTTHMPAMINTLSSPALAQKSFTFNAKLQATSSSNYNVKIALSTTNGFNNDLSSSSYGPSDPNAIIIHIENVTNNFTSFSPILSSVTLPAGVNYNYLIIYVDDIVNPDNNLQVTDVALNEVCEPLSFNCYCTQLADAEALYLQNNPGATTTDFANDLATHYSNEFASLGITASHIEEWIANCQATNDPNNTGGGSTVTLTVPEEINCNNEDPCLLQSMNIANYYNNLFDSLALDSAVNYFIDHYKASCFGGNFNEDFTVEYEDREYHYTLYYYDRAGNLVRTVAPEGVDKLNASFTQAVDNYRVSGVGGPTYPVHNFETRYEYNTLNQLTEQSTPDAGTTVFFYDAIGRLKASQNEKQANLSPQRYSYTSYDAQGRIIEVGELESSTPPNSTQLDASNFPTSWIGAANRYQVTYTQYDNTLNTTINGLFGLSGQENLRSRVASTYLKTVSSNTDWQYAYHYSYDIHGNVKEMITDRPPLATYGQQYKTLEYEYDLISGNVNKVSYQKGKSDQYYHKYCYDADNRIIEALTSKDDLLWDNDADYFYYLHGPLARTEIGEEKVQGMDYAYTIHGWLKGINSNNITSTLQADIGKDGISGALYAYNPSVNDVHDNLARDAYGFGLSYYEDSVDDDYKSISVNGDNFLTDINSLSIQPNNLYNGNIRQMATSLMNQNEALLEVQATNYGYDQLNRLIGMEAYAGDGNYTLATNNQYNTTYTYDANGNLLTLNRKATSNAPMDNLIYNYLTNASSPTNKLGHVEDIDGFQNFNDLDNQNAGNYDYDAIGNLIKDDKEEIADIKWTVYGKIQRITRTATSTKPDIGFRYDPSGNRILKVIIPAGTNQDEWQFYHYLRDASGNIMAIYLQEFEPAGTNLWKSKFKLIENPIYGSSRIGNEARDIEYQTIFAAQIGPNGTFQPVSNTTVPFPGGLQNATLQTSSGFDVLTGGSDVGFTLYSNNLVTVTGGPFTNVVGAENVGADFVEIPANTVVSFTTPSNVTISSPANTELEISSDLNVNYQAINQISLIPLIKKLGRKYQNYRGKKVYELTNHLGNVLATVSDRKESVEVVADNITDYFIADVKSYSDYYPFGSLMPGRYTSSGDYRYGFNGKEYDTETTGNVGVTYDYGFRIYDARLARFNSVDPLSKEYPWYSPYQFAGNCPSTFIDLDGLEPVTGQTLFWKELPELKQAWYPDIENITLFKSKGYHGDVIVARRWNSEGASKYYWLNNDNKWQEFNPFKPIADEVEEIAITSILVTGGAVGAAYLIEAAGVILIEELAEFVVEEVTGIPIIIDPIDVGEQLIKQSVKKTVKEGSEQVTKKGVDLELNYKEGWTKKQRIEADDKAKALSEAETSVKKDPTRSSNTRSKFRKEGNNVKSSQDVDHTIDLQLNGVDDISNLKALDKSVNRSLGKQINNKIKDLPDGTPINKVTIIDKKN